MKRGYRLKDGAQIPTRPTTVEEIMASLHFGYGVTDKGAGRGFRSCRCIMAAIFALFVTRRIGERAFCATERCANGFT
jgi:hypothetical protein